MNEAIQKISVIVPKNPFAPKALQDVKHCLAALDVTNSKTPKAQLEKILE
jgi:hypothetical protein